MRGHVGGSYGSWLAFFIARRFHLFLPSSTRVELCLRTLGALSSWSCFIFANKFEISPRRDSNSRTNTSSIRGLPLVHRGLKIGIANLDATLQMRKIVYMKNFELCWLPTPSCRDIRENAKASTFAQWIRIKIGVPDQGEVWWRPQC